VEPGFRLATTELAERFARLPSIELSSSKDPQQLDVCNVDCFDSREARFRSARSPRLQSAQRISPGVSLHWFRPLSALEAPYLSATLWLAMIVCKTYCRHCILTIGDSRKAYLGGYLSPLTRISLPGGGDQACI
jgi:hypothetical protein